jgi:hypothetical protein
MNETFSSSIIALEMCCFSINLKCCLGKRYRVFEVGELGFYLREKMASYGTQLNE